MKDKLTHNTNTVVLEVNAAKDLVVPGKGNFATVFAIHNAYQGEEKEPKAIPVSILFGANTVNLAKATISKGTRFVVTGAIDYEKKPDGKEFYSIRANALTPISRKKTAEEKAAETATS